MYSVGDVLVYGVHGLCRIENVEQRRVDRNTVSYFVLVPIGNDRMQFYVPVHNEAALSKLRPPITVEQAEAVFRSPLLYENCWIDQENQRKLRFKELLSGNNFAQMVQMVHTLRCHRQQQLEQGRKFHLCDENFLRDAQKILENELSFVLNIPATEVESYIRCHYFQ